MTDYSLNAHILRDQMADALVESVEQPPYVLAKVAGAMQPGSRSFDEFIELARDLDGEDRSARYCFFGAVAEMLLEDLDDDQQAGGGKSDAGQ